MRTAAPAEGEGLKGRVGLRDCSHPAARPISCAGSGWAKHEDTSVILVSPVNPPQEQGPKASEKKNRHWIQEAWIRVLFLTLF